MNATVDSASDASFDLHEYGDAALQQLVPAVELAMIAATRSSTPQAAVPAAIQRLTRFKKLPRHGVLQVLDAVDQHPEFRSMVGELLDDDSTNTAAMLFVQRPDGWMGDLDELLQAELQTAEEATASKHRTKLEKRLEQVEQLLQGARGELQRLHDENTALAANLDQQGNELQTVTSERDELLTERKTTIQQLKNAEDLARQRLQHVRDLEAQTHDQQPDGAPDVDGLHDQIAGYQTLVGDQQQRIVELTAMLSQTARELMDRLDEAGIVPASAASSTGLAERTGDTTQPVATTHNGRDGSESDLNDHRPNASAQHSSGQHSSGQHSSGQRSLRTGQTRSPRRIPVRLGKGLHEGTVEGARELLATPHIALVDAYNVTMKAWPQLDQRGQRDALIGASANVVKQIGGNFWLVFDGIAAGSRPSVHVPLEVRIFFSAQDQEADDLILELIDDLDVSQPVVVVSSDRRVQDGARERGASVVNAGLFLEVLGLRSGL